MLKQDHPTYHRARSAPIIFPDNDLMDRRGGSACRTIVGQA